MNIQTFLYNENFYKKLAFTIAIIRSTPSHLTPKEYTRQLQINLQRKKNHQAIQFEQILIDLRSLRQSNSMIIPINPLEYYVHFLQNLLGISDEWNIEIQTIVIETIDRIFSLIKENLSRSNDEILFRQTISLILNYDIIPHIQKHSIQHLNNFLRLTLTYIKQAINTVTLQILIEQIGCHPSYFLLVFEQILLELSIYFDRSNSHSSSYAAILINILQKLVTIHDRTVLEQILNNYSVRQQFHALLYTCLSTTSNDTSSMIHLWNIYGRIL